MAQEQEQRCIVEQRSEQWPRGLGLDPGDQISEMGLEGEEDLGER